MSRTLAAAVWLSVTSAVGCSRGEASNAERKLGNFAPVASRNLAGEGSSDARLAPEERTWVFESTPLGRMAALVLLPERARGERFPVLLAFHGRGEALKGPDRGARGWVEDYWLPRAIERIRRPPLTRADFLSFVTKDRLLEINRALTARAYRGLVIVCPYTPDRLAGEGFMEKSMPLARFVVEELLPRVYRETPALGTVASTGVDGVSLGGRAAYSVGLARPEAFGVIAGFQVAFDVQDAPVLLAYARSAKQKNPRLSFRMLTSRDDYFLEANQAIARAFEVEGLPMDFDIAEGPHDYAFNRGPGAYEMLLFHDSALRGEAPP